MPNTRDIRNRIKGVKSTRQITRAMQMVATSKMKKAQDEAKTGRPYALILADIIVSIADEFEELTQSYFVQRPIKTSRNSSYRYRQRTLRSFKW